MEFQNRFDKMSGIPRAVDKKKKKKHLEFQNNSDKKV